MRPLPTPMSRETQKNRSTPGSRSRVATAAHTPSRRRVSATEPVSEPASLMTELASLMAEPASEPAPPARRGSAPARGGVSSTPTEAGSWDNGMPAPGVLGVVLGAGSVAGTSPSPAAAALKCSTVYGRAGVR